MKQGLILLMALILSACGPAPVASNANALAASALYDGRYSLVQTACIGMPSTIQIDLGVIRELESVDLITEMYYSPSQRNTQITSDGLLTVPLTIQYETCVSTFQRL